MKPSIKYQVIIRHSPQYSISVMCQFFPVSRSGYYDFLHRQDRPEKDVELAKIISLKQEKCFETYGCRRMWMALKHDGIVRNPKTILRVMQKYNLLSEIRRQSKWEASCTSTKTC